jgi:hypothetical protein
MEGAAIRAGRLTSGGAAIVAAAVFADSGMEHYRGSFANRAMVLPIASSAAAMAIDAGLAVIGRPARPAPVVAAVHAAGTLTGAAGLGFHIYNIAKQVGGLRWETLFYQAPIGAPAALTLAGVLGAAGHVLGRGGTSLGPVSLRSGRALAGIGAVGLAGTAAEAALFHFRGAYHNPAMWLPVTIAPLSALALAKAAATGRFGWITTAALAATAALGLAGAAFHAVGVSRNMGGWRNWRQNLFAGPPLPAPPAFTGLAIAGLGALLLIGSRIRG